MTKSNQVKNLAFEKYLLPNGVRVVLMPDRQAVSTIVQVLVEAGSKYETKKLNGISHFVEHMVFKGTKKRPSTKIIAEEIDNVGGQMNAFTGQEETGYWIKTPAFHSELALDVVADIFLNPLLKQEELEKERGVIIQEIAMYEDMPMRKVEDVFGKLVYGDQPAGWSIAGPVQNIKKMQAKDLQKYMQKKYLPQKTVVTVVGNFAVDKMKQNIEKLFGNKKEVQKMERRRKTLEKQNKPSLKIENKDTDQTHLILGFRSFNRFDKRRYIASLLSTVLGGGMSSRMFLNIREKEGLAYYIHTSSDLSLDTGLFTVQAGVAKENLEKTVKLILKEIKKVIDKPISDKELQKAKEKIEGSTTIGLETVQAKAGFLGNQELFQKDIKNIDYILKQYDKITSADVQKIAKYIFKNSKLNLAIIGPHQKDKQKLKKILKV